MTRNTNVDTSGRSIRREALIYLVSNMQACSPHNDWRVCPGSCGAAGRRPGSQGGGGNCHKGGALDAPRTPTTRCEPYPPPPASLAGARRPHNNCCNFPRRCEHSPSDPPSRYNCCATAAREWEAAPRTPADRHSDQGANVIIAAPSPNLSKKGPSHLKHASASPPQLPRSTMGIQKHEQFE